MGNITAYIDQFGYIVLFFALLLEMIALPLPGDLLMTYSGFLVYQGHLNWVFSILIAGVGTSIGMTLSYWIGRKLGPPFFGKYGHRFHMGPERIEKTSFWFSKHGNKLLIIAYFIPGVRHITGYFSGITRIPFRTYALFAYSGAFLWVTVFVTLGKILGPKWELFHSSIKKYLIIGSIVAAFVLTAIYIYKKYKSEIKNAAINILNLTMKVFHSRKRVGLLISFTAVITLGLIILMIGMIEDFLGNEFQDFNEIMDVLIPLTFNEDWTEAMVLLSFMGSRQFLIMLIIFTLFWILWTGRDKITELLSFMIVVFGGELYEESLRRIFHKFSPLNYSLMDQLLYAFPSEQSLMTFVIYGFFVFISVRTARKVWIRTFVPITALVILFLIALSRLFLEVQLPSDVAAAYVFGGVWLGLNILLIEIFRLLRRMDVK
ncbi:VTT domain-containing protein [Bacillus sp. FJAT-29790]|uniref:VTT domain-containing protein n=1 Tax=Bacillus sp. FJAT-29790 TaxID=1895002 RepID=UPI001C24EB9D|nr:VTT domain-containing protein [Bacillus sp. FJAT-29790]MBU8879169.1 VTT domain-containing protein [Bacillus sp. FJAT-29790]